MTGHPMANYWMHNGYINIDNEKMSKSLGNGVNVNQLLKTISPQTLRYFMLSVHYRNPLNFSEETIEQANNGLARIENCLANIKHRLSTAPEGEVAEEILHAVAEVQRQFELKMNDDFNTPDAITAVFELVSAANPYLQQAEVTRSSLQLLLERFETMDKVLGILAQPAEQLLDQEIEQLIIDRTEARKSKNWARADEIRDLLTEKGITLEDTAQGIRWRRK